MAVVDEPSIDSSGEASSDPASNPSNVLSEGLPDVLPKVLSNSDYEAARTRVPLLTVRPLAA